MKKRITALLLFVFLASCKENTTTPETYETAVNWQPAHEYYLKQINETADYLDSLSRVTSSDSLAKVYFIKARVAFKKAEPYASYLNPPVGHQANGPALPRLTDDTQRVLQPIGLQRLEESIYEGADDEALFKHELKLTRGLIAVLQKNVAQRKLDAQRFFIATHQQLMRVLSFGITGFDTPVSGLGLEETAQSLKSLKSVYELSLQNLIKEKDVELNENFINAIDAAVSFIEKDTDFETFDRFSFVRDYLNPITRSWVEIRKTASVWEPVNSQAFNFDAPTFFEENSFNVEFFRRVTNRNPSEAQIALGERLFYDAKLSKDGTMACATCHIPDKAYADGLVTNVSNAGTSLKRNSPTLINSIFQQAFFWDGRAPDLMAQISGVFTNAEEFNSNVHEFSGEILKDSSYVNAFREVFGDGKLTNDQAIAALSSYISTLNAFDSKFDRNMRGEEDTFSDSEKLGMNLFMGKALCATCHFMPLTSGTVPPFFAETEKEVIGVPETAANKQLDDDLGFYFMYEELIQRGMFKTPTVRNAGVTAPYMHNGVYTTLEEVMDFYNKGGGAGLGFDLPHQTLPFDNLQLNAQEVQALTDFVNTLTDTTVEPEYSN
ncbi:MULTISPECIES: cytochrome c peroxidase [unclassified Leeuwenhoekiella]|uniref:cytochrome c peroxidase n=1 Tax=unclassified Leeuwenhoekiella TaxID=2615029 RepID=UPI000C5A8155|nr:MULTISPECIES: cytochrome c peroxidase [unclassified Leeuwenhoekiella]MAW94082.1 cytochrome-c peroxidase [Leeuwenhoekiella sp.]MBA80879.1 cytochrome-c peroxidase [Leeuwenhoekiella sp.]|tara:strand:+ start:85860 stop:87680 length:1821 start_codon:yes stop_codon:yes gene_type:complete